MTSRTKGKPASPEREYLVTYVTGKCTCENCHQTKAVTASSRSEASVKLQKMCSWAWVLRVD